MEGGSLQKARTAQADGSPDSGKLSRRRQRGSRPQPACWFTGGCIVH